MLALSLMLMVATAPSAVAAPSEKTRVLVAQLKGDAVDKNVRRTLTGVVTAELQRYPELDLLSGEDMTRALELEAEKAASGCSEDGSCLAEVAAALGAGLVVFGDVGVLGEKTVLNLSLHDTVAMRSRGRVVVEMAKLDTAPAAVRARVRDLLAPLYAEKGWILPDAASPLPLALAGGGALGVVVGSALAVVGALPYFAHESAKGELAALRARDDGEAALAAADGPRRAQTSAQESWEGYGQTLVIVGAVLTVASATAAGFGLAMMGGE